MEPLWYNNWRQVVAPALGEFEPELPVSVIVPYYARPEQLARTLAALEGQTYPRKLFEVVVVDDGSRAPLARPRSTALDVKVVRQEDQGFGLARARNTGVRAASHDVLLFLDADMLPEADWMAAHARWHHVVPDAVTLGSWTRVAVDGVDAETIRRRPGTLKELFEGRDVDTADVSWFDQIMRRTDDLTSKADDIFRVVAGGNLGVRRGFHELVGGFDESFTQWGGEDTEFGFRAYTRGGLLAPLRDALTWRQCLAPGRPEEGERRQEEKQRSNELQRAMLTRLIAHPGFRTGLSGRTFTTCTVPQYVVTIEAGNLPADRLLAVVERVLSGPVHDLVIRLEPVDHADREWLERHLGPDPRVRVAPSRTALEEFPASPFHVALTAERPLPVDVVRTLRTELGNGVIGRAALPEGTRASITRTWALHRALRTPWEASDFGDVVTISPGKLWPPVTHPVKAPPPPAQAPPGPGRAGSVPQRIVQTLRRHRQPRSAPWAERAEYPLGVEIAALGTRSRAVFAASRRVARTMAGQHVDVVVADTAPDAVDAAEATVPVVVLAEAPPLLSVPAFDPRTDNPVGWRREVESEVGALGPLDLLPPGCRADRVVNRHDRAALREIHHLEDVAAFHADPVSRAGELVRLAAMGVVVHLADGDRADGGRRLAPYLGAELFELMTGEARDLGRGQDRGQSRDLDIDGREWLSVRMRRAALREHSLTSRARQVAEHAALPDPPRLPLVSILLPTRRPELLDQVLMTVRRQTYPRLELILGLHGEGFEDVAPDAAGPGAPVTALRLDASLPLGSVLNVLTDAAGGTLLAKMDDDDLYGPEHIRDLVLAHEYSQAPLVGKAAEFVYLAASDWTLRRFKFAGSEQYGDPDNIVAGGALLITRRLLDRIGGWRRLWRSVDRALIEDALRTGVRVYRPHPYGYLLTRRHGQRHTWTADDTYFLAQAAVRKAGFRPELAGIDGARYLALRTTLGRLLAGLRKVDGPGPAWRFARWLTGAIRRRALRGVSRLLRRFRAAPPQTAPAIPVKASSPPVQAPAVQGAPDSRPRAEYPLGVEIAALGAVARAVFASRRVGGTMVRRHVDVVVADTAAEAAEATVPVVVLAEAPPLLSVPAFDPRTHNPMGWRREVESEVGALGPLDRLPPGCGADRVVNCHDRAALSEIHHLEDVAAFHADTVTRAGELVRLAAMGVVVHLADGDVDGDEGGRRLAPYLGAELFELMTREARDLGRGQDRDLDIDGRELLSIRMRRAALREHSLTSRARQVAEHAALPDPPRLPLVSILLPTRRPELLDRVLETVRRQTYPRLELVLGLHGEGFGAVALDAVGPSTPVTALRLDASLLAGSVLNAATQAAHGTLLAKMDDDDLYGPDHIWDLVLAHEYSQAPLVGKADEFVYLAASDRTTQYLRRYIEHYDTAHRISGAALLIERRMVDRIGGWKRIPGVVDSMLVYDVLRAGGRVYRTHSQGFLVIRHGRGHAWLADDAWFLARAAVEETGFRPDLAGISDSQQPYWLLWERYTEDVTP